MCCTQATQFPPKQVPIDYNATPPRTFVQSFIAIRYLKHHILLYASMLLVCLRPGASTWCPDQFDVLWFQNIQDIEGLRGEHVVSIPQSLSREFPLGFRPVFVNTASFAWLPPSLRVSASAGASLPSPATEPPQSDPFFRGASGSLRIRTQSSAGRPGVSKLGRSGTNSRRSENGSIPEESPSGVT